MDRINNISRLAFAMIFLVFLTSKTWALQVQDIIRLKGSESSKLVGMGLVTGLAGTGDGSKFRPAMLSLAMVIQRMGVASTVVSDLKGSKNVAIVILTANVPANGVREGDQIDVHVTTIGSAKSLAGGRLFLIPMTGPLPNSDIYAFAEGPITIEDKNIATVGVVRNGAQLVRDIRTHFVSPSGEVTFVIDDTVASWPTASSLANHINSVVTFDEGPEVARAVDPKNIVIVLPMADRQNPGSFLSQILTSFIDPDLIGTGARVKINEKTGTIVFGADVQISPSVITHGDLTITTVTPPIVASPQRRIQESSQWVVVDPEKRGGAKLADLVNALKQLRVSAQDRIAIVKELHKAGKLHAKLIIE